MREIAFYAKEPHPVEKDPRNQEAIFPYIGGQEVNSSPTHAHHRYVINFRDFPLCRESEAAGVEASKLSQTVSQATLWTTATEAQQRALMKGGRVPFDYPGPVAEDWPDLLRIVKERVKPERMKLGDNGDARRRKDKWWLWGRYTPAMFRSIAGLSRVLATSRVSENLALVFLPAGAVYSERLVVFPSDSHAMFCVLQCRVGEIWSRFFGSSLEDRLTYTPSDCFETFPFPASWETTGRLHAAGQRYYEFRAGVMVGNQEGTTTTYNRFHNPDENNIQVAQLRELHAAMDRAALDAYGWTDVPTDCDFLLDYEIGENGGRGGKTPHRYRWPDAVGHEVLARLLELNRQRAAEGTHVSTIDQARPLDMQTTPGIRSGLRPPP